LPSRAFGVPLAAVAIRRRSPRRCWTLLAKLSSLFAKPRFWRSPRCRGDQTTLPRRCPGLTVQSFFAARNAALLAFPSLPWRTDDAPPALPGDSLPSRRLPRNSSHTPGRRPENKEETDGLWLRAVSQGGMRRLRRLPDRAMAGAFRRRGMGLLRVKRRRTA